MDAIDELREEIDQHYSLGRLAIGVDGAAGSGASRIADELADAYRGSGREAVRATVSGDEAAFRAGVLEPFRRRSDVVLVVDGSGLLRRPWAGMWHFTVFVDNAAVQQDPGYLAEVSPFLSASAVLDLTDAAHPRRIFTDSC